MQSSSASPPSRAESASAFAGWLPFSYLWLVRNGEWGTIRTTVTTILPFPTNQGKVLGVWGRRLGFEDPRADGGSRALGIRLQVFKCFRGLGFRV